MASLSVNNYMGVKNAVPWNSVTGAGGNKNVFSSGGTKDPTSTSTTKTSNTSNTTGSSTQKDTGTIRQETLVPAWAQQANQNQYTQAQGNNELAGNFYESVLGGTNTQANLASQRMLQQYLQQVTSAPGFTETGAAAQGIASGEALAAVEAAMFGRMENAAQGIQGVGQNTIPFLNNAGNWAPKQETRNLTSTTNSNQTTTGSGNSTTTNSVKGTGGGSSSTATILPTGTNGGYQGPMYGNKPGLPSAGAGLHPLYAAFLAQNNPGYANQLSHKGVY